MSGGVLSPGLWLWLGALGAWLWLWLGPPEVFPGNSAPAVLPSLSGGTRADELPGRISSKVRLGG